MRRIPWLLVLMLVLAPRAAGAIQLHWAGGATDLTVDASTQAVLVVQADSAEVTLPNSWRFQWTADSLGIEFARYSPGSACLVDTAKVDSIAPPSSPADSAANQSTAWFCSSGSNNAATAYFLANLPAGGHGKLRVVALDPNDTTQVIESDEVTFNGGLEGGYAPCILGTIGRHETAQLEVTILGTDLAADLPLRVGTADGIWSVPLTVTSQSSRPVIVTSSVRRKSSSMTGASVATTLTAVADVPGAMPQTVVSIGEATGSVAEAPLAADEIDALESSLPDTVLFRDPNWTSVDSTTVYPKDFAFFYNVVAPGSGPWRGLFHLIYIRHNNNYDASRHHGIPSLTSDTAESLLVHAWSPDLRNWKVDKRAFAPSYDSVSTSWDHLHVWAPSLLPVGGGQVYMFYTGVDGSHNQRIGYVTTSLLDTSDTQWSPVRTLVYQASNTGWADHVGHTPNVLNQQQFRDPWVMPDPDHAGKFLMFNVGEDLNPAFDSLGYQIVGVAQNVGSSLSSWADLGAYRPTDYGHTGITRAESPLVMRDSTAGAPWRIFIANSDYDSIGSNSTFFRSESLGFAASDTTLRRWPGLDSLSTYLGGDHNLYGWEASEHVQIGPYHFFAGYNGDGIAITRTRWDPSTHTFLIGDPLTAVSGAPSAATAGFKLLNYRPGVRVVRFGIEFPRPVTPRLVVYDVSGRRVRTLLDGRAFTGRQEVQWDCRDATGGSVPAGMYFARMTGAGPQQVRRVVVLR